MVNISQANNQNVFSVNTKSGMFFQ